MQTQDTNTQDTHRSKFNINIFSHVFFFTKQLSDNIFISIVREILHKVRIFLEIENKEIEQFSLPQTGGRK